MNNIHALHTAIHNIPVCDGTDNNLGTPLSEFFGLQSFLKIKSNHFMPVIQ